MWFTKKKEVLVSVSSSFPRTKVPHLGFPEPVLCSGDDSIVKKFDW